MNRSDKILFEKYFYYKGSKNFSNKQFQFLINILLNSKELENSELLTFHCTGLDKQGYKVRFEAYYVDKLNKINKSMEGFISLSKKEVTINSKVTYYTGVVQEFNFYEVFYIENSNYYRFSSYPNKDYNTYLGSDLTYKYSQFEEKTLRKLRG